MTTPSNPSGIPSLPVIGLLAVILFLGLALAPRAFEFRAWPEFARPDAVEEIVDRPVPEAPRVEVAGVRASDARRGAGDTRDAVRGDRRAGGRADRRRVRGERSTQRRSASRGSKRGGGSDRSTPAPANDAPQVVDVPSSGPSPEAPAQAPGVPELPPKETVLRPEAPAEVPTRDFDVTARGGDLDVRGRGKGRGKGHGRGGDNGRGHGRSDGPGHGGGKGRGHGRGHGRD